MRPVLALSCILLVLQGLQGIVAVEDLSSASSSQGQKAFPSKPSEIPIEGSEPTTANRTETTTPVPTNATFPTDTSPTTVNIPTTMPIATTKPPVPTTTAAPTVALPLPPEPTTAPTAAKGQKPDTASPKPYIRADFMAEVRGLNANVSLDVWHDSLMQVLNLKGAILSSSLAPAIKRSLVLYRDFPQQNVTLSSPTPQTTTVSVIGVSTLITLATAADVQAVFATLVSGSFVSQFNESVCMKQALWAGNITFSVLWRSSVITSTPTIQPIPQVNTVLRLGGVAVTPSFGIADLDHVSSAVYMSVSAAKVRSVRVVGISFDDLPAPRLADMSVGLRIEVLDYQGGKEIEQELQNNEQVKASIQSQLEQTDNQTYALKGVQIQFAKVSEKVDDTKDSATSQTGAPQVSSSQESTSAAMPLWQIAALAGTGSILLVMAVFGSAVLWKKRSEELDEDEPILVILRQPPLRYKYNAPKLSTIYSVGSSLCDMEDLPPSFVKSRASTHPALAGQYTPNAFDILHTPTDTPSGMANFQAVGEFGTEGDRASESSAVTGFGSFTWSRETEDAATSRASNDSVVSIEVKPAVTPQVPSSVLEPTGLNTIMIEDSSYHEGDVEASLRQSSFAEESSTRATEGCCDSLYSTEDVEAAAADAFSTPLNRETSPPVTLSAETLRSLSQQTLSIHNTLSKTTSYASETYSESADDISVESFVPADPSRNDLSSHSATEAGKNMWAQL